MGENFLDRIICRFHGLKTRGVYAFDVDYTLEFAGGPVAVRDLYAVKRAGFTVGIVGNAGKAVEHGISGLDFYLWGRKTQLLLELKRKFEAETYTYVADLEEDCEAATNAGWAFVYAKDWRPVYKLPANL
jgi:hypothetical protein